VATGWKPSAASASVAGWGTYPYRAFAADAAGAWMETLANKTNCRHRRIIRQVNVLLGSSLLHPSMRQTISRLYTVDSSNISIGTASAI